MKNRWFWVFSSVMAIGLGVSAAPVIWHVLGEVQTDAPTLSAQAAGTEPAAQPMPDIAAILAFAPFGTIAPAPAPVTAEIPATQLGLTLLGLTIANPATASRAMIAGGDVPVGSYAVGQAITASVTLSEVRADHVILLVGGAPEALYFANAQAGAVPSAAYAVPIITNGPSDPGNPDAVIAFYRDEILQNPQSVLDRLGLQATPDGYLISDAADPDVRRAGFQPGDLVTRVNGLTVGNVAQDQTQYDQIAASGRATVEVQRAGQIITMTFPLR